MLLDCKNIVGRGCVLICDDEGFNVGDKITLTIRGVERLSPTNWKAGLVVSPQMEIIRKEKSE